MIVCVFLFRIIKSINIWYDIGFLTFDLCLLWLGINIKPNSFSLSEHSEMGELLNFFWHSRVIPGRMERGNSSPIASEYFLPDRFADVYEKPTYDLLFSELDSLCKLLVLMGSRENRTT